MIRAAVGSLFFGLLLSCGNADKVSSTEVENQVALHVSGYATRSSAARLAKVRLYDPSGKLLDSTTTGDRGEFSIDFKAADLPSLPLLAEVEDSVGSMLALMRSESLEKKKDLSGDTLYALVNPVTHLVLQKKFGTLSPEQGFEVPDYAEFLIFGESGVDGIFGSEVGYDEFSSEFWLDPELPSSAEILLLTMADHAKEKGLSLEAYLNELYDSPELQAMLDERVQLRIVATMVELDVSPDQAFITLGGWGISEESMPLFTALDAVDEGDLQADLQNILLESVIFSVVELFADRSDSTRKSLEIFLPDALNIIAGEVSKHIQAVDSLLVTEKDFENATLLMEEIGVAAAAALAEFTPSGWETKRGEIAALVSAFVEKDVLQGSSVENFLAWDFDGTEIYDDDSTASDLSSLVEDEPGLDIPNEYWEADQPLTGG